MRSLTAILLLTACGGSSDPEDPTPDTPTVEPCTPEDVTIPLGAATSWQLGALGVEGAAQPWFVLAKQLDQVTDFVIVDPDGTETTVMPGIPNATGQNVIAIELAGKRCFAMHTFDEEFHFACEGGAVEIPGLDLGGKMSAVVVDGTVHVFGQDFAAYQELRRTSGSWQPIEKFESSVSKAEDAVRFQGNAVSCFLNIDDHASIDTLSGDPIYGEGIATWCRLIANGNELTVLTDLGITSFTGSTLGGWQPTAADSRPLAVGHRDAADFAVLRRDNQRIELQPLPNGTPTVLATLTGSSDAAHAVVAEDRIVVSTLANRFENGQTTFELRSSTRCMD